MKKADALALKLAVAICAAALFLSMVIYSRGTAPSSSAATPPSPSSIKLVPVADGFEHPTTIANAGDGSNRLFILEQPGMIRIVKEGKVLPEPFLDIRKLVRSRGSEQGLLGIAFDPDFAKSRTFYVNYTGKKGIGNTVIARFKVGSDPDRADPASRQEILKITQPFPNHNGGQLAFGPDRFLYIGTGDGGSGGDPFGNGQNKDTLLGKLLRIDVRSGATRPYAIPPGNPFGNEVWAYGLRNPWRFSFDRENGDLYIGDVGQNEVEEIDHRPAGKGAGANFGWNVMEGSDCFRKKSCNEEGLVPPVAEYRHGKGDCSVTGGYVYRGTIGSLEGSYLFADYCSGRIWGMRKKGSRWEVELLTDSDAAVSTFGEDERGELYLADYAQGKVYRIGVP